MDDREMLRLVRDYLWVPSRGLRTLFEFRVFFL